MHKTCVSMLIYICESDLSSSRGGVQLTALGRDAGGGEAPVVSVLSPLLLSSLIIIIIVVVVVVGVVAAAAVVVAAAAVVVVVV